jgi:choline-glycine betaine transporter
MKSYLKTLYRKLYIFQVVLSLLSFGGWAVFVCLIPFVFLFHFGLHNLTELGILLTLLFLFVNLVANFIYDIRNGNV